MPPFVLVLCSVDVFVDPVSGKITPGPFAMPAARAVKRLIAGVVEAAFAGLDWGLTVRFGASGRMADRDPLGIGFEPASHTRCSFRFRPAPALAAGGVLRLLSDPRNFSARPLYLGKRLLMTIFALGLSPISGGRWERCWVGGVAG